MTALVVDDDPGIRHRVRDQLQDRGMQVMVAGTVADAMVAVKTNTFLVVLVGLTLPDGSGLEVVDVLRDAGSDAHVIVTGASTAEADRVAALQRGADDFVVKPFFLRELTARVLAVRRRRDPQRDTRLPLGRCDIDLRARQVTCAGELVELTAKEFDLLAYLAVRPGHVFSREQLLNAVWGSTSEWQQPATVTEHIRRIRNKVELDPARPTMVVTVRGAGYRLDLPAQDQSPAAAPPLQQGVLIHIDTRIVFADEAAAAIIGAADGSSLVGRSTLELIGEDSLVAASARIAAIDAGQQRRSELLQFRRADGDTVAVEVSSAPTDWHGERARRVQLTALTDVSARLRRFVTGILADVADAVIISDLHFHIRSWNAAAERIYGWTEEAVLGRHILDVLHWVGDDGQLVEAWEDLERTGRWNGTGRQAARDGSMVDVLGCTTLLRDDAGEPIAIVSVNRLIADAGVAPAQAMSAELADRIRQGIAADEFDVHYQPIVNLVDGRILTLEALVRWQHPERGTLAPAEFLDVAERSGLIVQLGEVVLGKACRQAAAWRRDGADILLSVNVSTRQLAERGFAERVLGIVRTSGFDPAYLWLEITETSLVVQLERAAEALQMLVSFGVGISIDDFGTGWASLTYLQSFPVHTLKIDRRFVAGMERPGNDAAIVRSILSLAAELDLFAVAEGVETVAQQALLESMGCILGQGYLFGRPVPAAQVPIERARRLEKVLAGTTGGGRHGGVGDADQPSWSVPEVAPAGPPSLPPPVGGEWQRGSELVESDVVAALLRGLMRVTSAAGAVDLLHCTIRQMGGQIVPVDGAGSDALPIDVSLGEGSPQLVTVERLTVARMQLERLLPRLVEDTRQAVDLRRRTERLEDATVRDSLTGLGNRRVLDRILPRVRTGSVALLDLDHFKVVNDEHGHAAGDEVLRSFGALLSAQIRAHDTVCRIGGEEFAVVLDDLGVPDAIALIDRMRTSWAAASPRPVTFSAGVAAVAAEGGAAALAAADLAMYEAKGSGRNRTVAARAAAAPDEPG
jgi:diguanylate cyclase (GGDEF)-like protein/PAS domain S-box-containing protein